MNSRERLHATFHFHRSCPPPRYEAEFHDDVRKAWKRQLGRRSIEDAFQLDREEEVPIQWAPPSDYKSIPDTDTELATFRSLYDSLRPALLPRDWKHRLHDWRHRDYALTASPWDEGLFQILGVRDWPTLQRALALLCENPGRVDTVMDHYTVYLESLIDFVLGQVQADLAWFYEPIASNHAPVISPDWYARFSISSLRRITDRLDHHGIRFRILWTTGRIHDLIPLWLDAGINGLLITQTADSHVSYLDLRRRFGPELLLIGGINTQAILQGPAAIDSVLRDSVQPLLAQGGYIPHLDDRVRPPMPFENYQYYRTRLNALLDKD